MRFREMLKALDKVLAVSDGPENNPEITAPVSEDNRAITPGGLFVARKGLNTDSHDFIAKAIAAGAVAVVGERAPDAVDCPVAYAQVADAMQAVGPLAAAYYGFPSRSMTIIGVTGTDGKTTTTNLIYNILKAAGHKVGMISTVSAVIGADELPTGLHVTTPSAPEIQMYLRRMVDSGLTHCVLESTSHGLAQGRVRGVEYDVAVMTNITHEHLDYHGSFENYRAAKGLMFQYVAQSDPKFGVSKAIVVNADDPSADYILLIAPEVEPFLYSIRGFGTINLASWRAYPGGMMVHFDAPEIGVSIASKTALVGMFNVQNILAAAATGFALGIAPEAIKAGIEAMPPVPGRMERIDEGQNFLAVVDFAHTPNALQRALEAGRTLTEGRVIAVFGSAGLRDREKRRLMAEVSADLADISVFTAEDPRTEPLEGILQVMADAAISRGGVEGETFYRVADRGEAIAFACSLAQPGDLVMACGKGHEQSMCFGTTEYPWDDRDAMRAALRGSPLRTLPTARK